MNISEKIKTLIKERNELETDLEFTSSQEKKEFIEDQIFDINHSIKTLQTYGKLEIRPN